MLWKQSYETGVAMMDSQHRELFKQLDILSDKANADRVPKVLDFLGKYVVKHFGDEERMHIASRYPGGAEHKKMHSDFVESYGQLMREYNEKPERQSLMTLRINRIAVDWLRKHIQGPDMMFARYLHEKEGTKEGTSPISPGAARPITKSPAPLAAEQPKKAAQPSSTSTFKSLSGKILSAADEAVLRRVPAEALAEELVRRAGGNKPAEK